jgi:hypothetical protein
LLLKNEPDRSLLHFDWILGYFSHGHILSRVCASGKFGPVQPVNGRLVVVETSSGAAIGLVPIRYNYLLVCIGKNYKYAGTVLAGTTRPLPAVKVELGPV